MDEGDMIVRIYVRTSYRHYYIVIMQIKNCYFGAPIPAWV